MTAPYTTTTATIETLRQAAEAEEPTDNRFRLSWVDCVFDAAAPLEFLVGDETNGLITKGSVNLFVGAPGAKKTWAALDLAVCVAMGMNWLDFPTRQTSVLIVDEESGERRLKRRILETLNGHLVKRDDAPPIAYTSLAQLNMTDPESRNALSAAIRESNAGLVIIDALADIMPGADENAVKDVQPIFMHLRSIAEVNQTSIILIHHNNKQNGYRGSTAISGAIDLMLTVDSTPDSKYVSFDCTKARDIEPRRFTAIAVWQRETSQFYLTATDVNPKAYLNPGQSDVLTFIAQNPNSTTNEIIEGTDSTRTIITNLKTQGYTRRTNETRGGKGNQTRYEITKKGEDVLKAMGDK
jgi:hypothetical protein